MELVRGAINKNEIVNIDKMFKELDVHVYQINENISELALKYFRGNFHKNGIGISDCFIVSTALFYDEELVTLDKKHFTKATNINVIIPHQV